MAYSHPLQLILDGWRVGAYRKDGQERLRPVSSGQVPVEASLKTLPTRARA
jgi:hypothetical protein